MLQSKYDPHHTVHCIAHDIFWESVSYSMTDQLVLVLHIFSFLNKTTLKYQTSARYSRDNEAKLL